MPKYSIVSLVAGILLVLLVTSGVLAMSSDNYVLNWFVPLTGSGVVADSTNYAAQVTLGQTVVGVSSSTNYTTKLGYWYGAVEYRLYLPVIVRN